MKFLKYLFLFLLLLVISFFVKGMMTPEIEYDCEISVNKSIPESWAVMSDEENLPNWIKGYIRSELVSGEANTVGAISNVYVEEEGKEMVMQEKIVDVENNKHMAMEFSMDFMNMDYRMEFIASDDKTIIRTSSKTKGNHLLAKSIISFMGNSMKSQEDENLAKLKTLIESNTKNYFPTLSTEEEVLEAEN